jgi:DNA-binding GntR family transcriptional regulator
MAYEWIREAILEFKFQPGEPISDRAIAHQLGISRTPVRDVLLQLSAEDLVEIHPRRGVFAKNISVRDVMELLQLREILEGLAARLAAGAIPAETIRNLIARYEAILSGPPPLSRRELLTVGAPLHETIWEHCANGRLSALLRSLRVQILRAQYFVWDALRANDNNQEFKQRTTSDHLRILDALAAGDGDRADREMRMHIASTRADLTRVLTMAPR